ncbi:Histidine ammonia-lyase [Salinivirga cyanobacteriivorans]|uniref:Histidine ammonia-lyase n=1 Tax=Salinivirga cyanobacteriivorans TaxID=1307839 RepID=A0A0S2I4G1_9BACT|nr:histidine ammonia-lyase [Salinivirga cyanobacteriivorans]ALO17083.1 Histidine ammonia-lyase [Salinivirga cyanobacteriivorans]
MDTIHHISPEPLTFEIIEEIIAGDYKLALSDDAKQLIQESRDYLDQKMAKQDDPIYGINTGFGSLCDKKISKEDLSSLQRNLVMSHACGTGNEVHPQIVKLMLLFKAHALSLGKSGVQLQTVERIIEMFNHDIIPVVYELGSLGASGDLAPLAHLFLPLLGEGEVIVDGKRMPSAEMLKKQGWETITLRSKEGLALLNGTQFMTAHAAMALIRAFKLQKLADLAGALSIDAFDGIIAPFSEELQQVRPHEGQIETARNIRAMLLDSEINEQEKEHVQDPYSFRCIPQVHGATKDAVSHVSSVVLTEINSVTDNPTIFVEEDKILSGGNFHGQPLALSLDYMVMALSELGNISERRVAQLISGKRGLPEFLVANPGLNSGLMIPQYTAASIVNKNKQLSVPNSIDSIVSSNGQEDHVSMGANSATKLSRVVDNLERLIAIELINASQALEFRKPLKTSPYLEEFLAVFREEVPFVKDDRVLYEDIERAVSFIRSGSFE